MNSKKENKLFCFTMNIFDTIKHNPYKNPIVTPGYTAIKFVDLIYVQFVPTF